MEVQCLSVQEAKKRNKSINDSEGIQGKIEVNDVDPVICVGTQSHTEFKCFRWDAKKSKAVRAGGWVT